MKAPKNFDKIRTTKFESTSGNRYRIGLEDWTDEPSIVWAFREPDTTTYCLAVIIYWGTECYEVKRAINGEGTNWDKTLHEGNINKDTIKSMDKFIDWFLKVISVFEYDYK